MKRLSTFLNSSQFLILVLLGFVIYQTILLYELKVDQRTMNMGIEAIMRSVRDMDLDLSNLSHRY